MQTIEDWERYRDPQRKTVGALTRGRATLVPRRQLKVGHPASPPDSELEIACRRLRAERAEVRPLTKDRADVDGRRRGGEEIAHDAQLCPGSVAQDRGEALPRAAQLRRLGVDARADCEPLALDALAVVTRDIAGGGAPADEPN